MTVRQLSSQEKQQLHDVLLGIRGMHDHEQRSLYVQELQSQLDHRLPLARHPDAHHDVWSVLDACLAYTGALRCLALIVRDFQGRSDRVVELFRLVDELEPAWLLEGTERTPLARLLAGLPASQLTAVYGATVPPATQVPPDWGQPTTMIFHLESLQSPSAGPPLLLEFV